MAYTPSLAPELYTDANQKSDALLMLRMAQQDKEPVSIDSSKPRFTLVVGPSPFTMPRGWEFFLTSPYEGASYIATVLHNAGYPVRIVDARYSPDPLQEAYDQIIGTTDVLGVCTFEDNYPWVKALIDRVKEQAPEMPVICGGSLCTSVPHVFMEDTQSDVVVVSEGELTILELMDAYTGGHWPKRLPHIRGIWYRDSDGRATASPPRGQMPDLDCLPRMRLDLWPQASSPMGMQPQIISSYSRGCKMDCSFCYRTTPLERVKSPEKLDEDLAWFKSQYNTDFIFFVDLTWSSYKEQTLKNCEVIQDHDIRWTCLTRCADVDPARLTAMKKSGCDIALYGVESLAKGALKEARKGNTENITVRAMHNTWDAGIRFGGLLIVGLPGETEETLTHTAEWSEEFGHITRVKYLSAMPGTSVYQSGVNDGLIRSEVDHLNWLSIEQALVQDEFLNYTGMPESFLRKSYKRIYDSYQPGPVVDFQHYPEYFSYFQPNRNDGANHAKDYGGAGWRAEWSSAGPGLIPGSEEFTLDKVGTPEMAARGSQECSLLTDPAAEIIPSV